MAMKIKKAQIISKKPGILFEFKPLKKNMTLKEAKEYRVYRKSEFSEPGILKKQKNGKYAVYPN